MSGSLLPYEPPETQISAPRSHVLRNVFIACGGVLLIGAALVGTCAHLLSNRQQELAPVAEAYFAKISEGDFHGAYASFGKSMHTTMTEVDYVSFDKRVHELLGKLQSRSVSNTQAGITDKGAWAVEDFQGHFERGDGTIRLRFEKESGIWKVVGVGYFSSAFKDAFLSKDSDGGTINHSDRE